MGILAHLAGRVLRTLFGVFFAGIFFGALGAGSVLAVAYATNGVWPPQTLATFAAVALGVVLALQGSAPAGREVESRVCRHVIELAVLLDLSEV